MIAWSHLFTYHISQSKYQYIRFRFTKVGILPLKVENFSFHGIFVFCYMCRTVEGIFLGISIEFAHCGCPNIKNSNNGFKKDDRKPKGCTKSLKVARGSLLYSRDENLFIKGSYFLKATFWPLHLLWLTQQCCQLWLFHCQNYMVKQMKLYSSSILNWKLLMLKVQSWLLKVVGNIIL